MLSEDTIYATYIVFKEDEHLRGFGFPVQEASVSVGETNLTRKVCLQSNDGEDEAGGVPHPHDENVALPRTRADGWMELELGEFPNIGRYDEDGEVSFSLMETKGGKWKSGLIVQGIEVRRKKRSKKRMLKLLPLKYYPRFSEYLPLLL